MNFHFHLEFWLKISSIVDNKENTMTQVHSSPPPVRLVCDGKSVNINIVKAAGARKPNLITRYREVEEKLSQAEEYKEPII